MYLCKIRVTEVTDSDPPRSPWGGTAIPGNRLAQRLLLRRSGGALCVAPTEPAKRGVAPERLPPHAQDGPAERGTEEAGGNPPPDPWLRMEEEDEGGASDPRAPSTRLS